MSIGLIKWFYQGSSLYEDVKKHLPKDISNVRIDQVVDIIFEARKYKGTWFEDSKRSAIKSAVKEEIRSKKTIAIAKLFNESNITIQQFESLPDSNKRSGIKSQIGLVANQYKDVLTADEMELALMNRDKLIRSSTINEAFNFGITRPNSSKVLMKEIERQLPFKIADNQVKPYKTYYDCICAWSEVDINDSKADENNLLVTDLNRNFLVKFTSNEKEEFTEDAGKHEFKLNTSTNLRKLLSPSNNNETGLVYKYLPATRNAAERLIAIMESDQDLYKKVYALEKLSKIDKSILSEFNVTDINFMNRIYGTTMHK